MGTGSWLVGSCVCVCVCVCVVHCTARHAEREVMRLVEVVFSFFVRSGVESAVFFAGDDHAS